jgi:hypothetical protein
MRGMSWRASAIAFAAYSFLAVALTFPLVLHLSSAVPHDLGDPLVSTSILWWNAHVLPLTARWWNGFAFYPSPGMLAFSDHRLGESLVASPLQWLGCSPLAAYNLTLLLTFPLCALSAHWLGFTLTKRHGAGVIAGLVYGFSPYRIAHLEHLELLAAFDMPATLVALHQFVATRRRAWLAVIVVTLTLQGLCTSYYLLFFCVLLLLWAVWFVRIVEWRRAAAIAGACACSVALLLPIAIGFWRIHQQYGFARPLNDIVTLSADLTSFVTASPMVALWGWTGSWNGPERQLFPGLTVVALVVAGAIVAFRQERREGRRALNIASVSCAAIALLFAAAAVAAAALGPRRFELGPLAVTIGVPFKPLSLAIIASAIAFALSPPAVAAFGRRSAFGFYVAATVVLSVLCLGPKPRVFGHQFWYESPYAWLMRLPLFGDGVRVPARFAMPAILTLSAAGALAFNRLRLSGVTRRLAVVALAAGIVADGWMRELPLLPPPEPLTLPGIGRFAAVAELPMDGDLFAETAAMWRATRHGRPVVNGNSGYDPPEYWALRVASLEHDWSALRAYSSAGPLLIAVERARDKSGRVAGEVRALPDARYVSADAGWTYFELARSAEPRPCQADQIPVVAARDKDGPVDVKMLTDTDPMTRWLTRDGQAAGEMLELDLGRVERPCDIRLSLGLIAHVYPRALNVAASVDRVRWEEIFSGRTAAATIRGAVAQPRDIWVDVVPTRLAPARYLRLRLEESQPHMPWVVAAVVVKGTPAPSDQ